MSEPMRDEVELPELETKHGGHCQCIVCDKEYWYQVAKEREAQLKAALAANREKDAEIERLKSYRSWDRIHELEAELASLRASVGEKWIECKQELPPMEEDRGFGPCSRRVLINQPVYAILNRPEGCDMWWMDDEENEVHPLEWKPDSPTKDKE